MQRKPVLSARAKKSFDCQRTTRRMVPYHTARNLTKGRCLVCLKHRALCLAASAGPCTDMSALSTHWGRFDQESGSSQSPKNSSKAADKLSGRTKTVCTKEQSFCFSVNYLDEYSGPQQIIHGPFSTAHQFSTWSKASGLSGTCEPPPISILGDLVPSIVFMEFALPKVSGESAIVAYSRRLNLH
jgi:hypothetical protein